MQMALAQQHSLVSSLTKQKDRQPQMQDEPMPIAEASGVSLF